MSVKKRIIFSIVMVVGILAFGRLWQVIDSSRSQLADNATKLADFHSTDKAAIERGEYVMRLGDCAACHQSSFAGGYKITTPFGELQTSNISPDRETGIGNMTERDFFNAVRLGRGDHGFLYPAMPYTAYAKMSDTDMHDLWAYVSTIKPVKNKVDENDGMAFPYNIRLAMLGWNMLFFDNNGFTPDIAKNADQANLDMINRGKYLVDGPAHCSVCHTARNALGGEISGGYLQGGSLGAWYAPDITQNPTTGLGEWSSAEIAQYLKTGSNGTSVAAGPMAEAIEHSMQYFTDSDVQAVAAYIKTLPSSGRPAPTLFLMDQTRKDNAALAYEVNCSACHGVKGEGITGMIPAFAGNSAMQNDPTNMINAMLNGARAPHTETRQTAAGMPSFAWKMDDQQMADILNYVRNNWGNQGDEVTTMQVKELRKVTAAQNKLVVPAP